MNGELFKIADAAAFVAAIDRELDERARENVLLVRKGRLSQREADYLTELLRDVRSDLAHAFGPLAIGAAIERADPAVRWRAKVKWVAGELAHTDDYPELVRKGRMTIEDAKRKTRMIATLHRLYWRELFMWEPDTGPALDFLLAIRSRKTATSEEIDRAVPNGREAYRELVRKHVAGLELEAAKQMELVA